MAFNLRAKLKSNVIKSLSLCLVTLVGVLWLREDSKRNDSGAADIADFPGENVGKAVTTSGPLTMVNGGLEAIPPKTPHPVGFPVVDVVETYTTASGVRSLQRVAGQLVIRAKDGADEAKIVRRLESSAGVVGDYRVKSQFGSGFFLVSSTEEERDRQLADPARLDFVLEETRNSDWAETVNPVFVDPANGLRLIPSDAMVLRLAKGVDPESYFEGSGAEVKPLLGTDDQFVLNLPSARADEVFAEVNRRMAEDAVAWAEPDFHVEVRKMAVPNDPLFGDQWHLNNTGQTGATPDADADLPEAWDVTTGDNNIVIAVIDDGVETAHPDLNIFQNVNDPLDGIDNDNNGLTDDVNGWDFLNGDNDANPGAASDNHGTSVAGVAAAIGGNSTGVTGSAQQARVLPVKLLGTTNPLTSSIANSIRYSAGLTNPQSWGGADVINMSIGYSQFASSDSALSDAYTLGRGGKGCAIFAATGNDAGQYSTFALNGVPAGNWIMEWRYEKDGANSAGEDTVRLANVRLPDGTAERFNAPGLPAGWSTGGDTPFFIEDDPDIGSGSGRYHARSGAIGDNESSTIRTGTITVPGGGGDLVYSVFSSTEVGDNLSVFASSDGGASFFGPFLGAEGSSTINTAVGYPASHADTIAVGSSTDFDYKSTYSQFGPELDFISPSNGGQAGITTTDRTGDDGYTTGSDYTPGFGGTSSATPLAAGIGALLLSVNPNLTAAQVRSILRDTTDQVGGLAYPGGRNDHFGHGRINAHSAILALLKQVSFTSATFNEDENGGSVNITVSRIGNTAGAASVDVDIIEGTALAGSDYTDTSGTLNWADGDGADKMISLPVLNDGTVELDETVTFALSNPVGISIGDIATTVLTIGDEDSATINVTGESRDEEDGSLDYSVTLSAPVDTAVTVEFDTIAGGTATGGGTDFTDVSNQVVTFPANTTTGKTVTVNVNTDGVVESDETVIGEINNLTAAGRDVTLSGGGASKSATGTILNDDTPPVVSPADLTTDTGTSSTDNLTNNNAPTFEGTASAGSTVTLTSSVAGVMGSGLANGAGNWSINASIALADGTHQVTAQATDAFGNDSLQSSALAVTIDTVAPDAPTGLDLAVGSDSGSSNTDNITNINTPNVGGDAEAGSLVTLFSGVTSIGSTMANSPWSITTSVLPDAVHSLTATAADAAGNISAASAVLSVQVDTVVPAAPSTPDLSVSSDSGSSDSDNVTNDNTPEFTGTAEAGATVVLFRDGGSALNTSSNGTWSIISGGIPDGNYTFTARATDVAGNVSALSGGLGVLIDTVAPAQPSTPDLDISSDKGISSSDEITNDNTPTFSGTSDASVTVKLFRGATSTGSVLSNGVWTLTTGSLSDGPHVFSAKATDLAGNESAGSGTLNVTVDTVSPDLSVELSGAQDDPATSGPVEFTATFGEPVYGFDLTDVNASGNAAGDVTVSGGPSVFAVSIESTTDEGFVQASVDSGVAIDAAGNANLASTSTDNRVSIDNHGNEVAGATVVSLNEGLGRISGFIEPGDSDFFTFTLTGPRIAVIYTEGSVDTIGTLRDETEEILNAPLEDDDEGSDENFRISEPLPAGTYTVEVAANSGEGEYELHFEAVDLPTIQPDISVNGRGDNVYGTIGGQVLSLVSRKARTVRGTVAVNNDGAIPDSFLMSARRGNGIFKVSYISSFSGNVSAALAAGTHSTGVTEPEGQAERIQTVIKPNKRRIKKVIRRRGKKKTIYKKKRFTITFSASSVAESGQSDIGQIKVKTK